MNIPFLQLTRQQTRILQLLNAGYCIEQMSQSDLAHLAKDRTYRPHVHQADPRLEDWKWIQLSIANLQLLLDHAYIKVCARVYWCQFHTYDSPYDHYWATWTTSYSLTKEGREALTKCGRKKGVMHDKHGPGV